MNKTDNVPKGIFNNKHKHYGHIDASLMFAKQRRVSCGASCDVCSQELVEAARGAEASGDSGHVTMATGIGSVQM